MWIPPSVPESMRSDFPAEAFGLAVGIVIGLFFVGWAVDLIVRKVKKNQSNIGKEKK